MRAIAMLAAGLLVGGCDWFGLHGPRPRDAACPSADAGLDAGPLACDRPAVVDPSAVVDLASFRAQASALVCDWSLRCGWGVFGDSFCHPAFAALAAAQVAGTEPFVLASGHTCVSQLVAVETCEDAWSVAWDCYFLNAGMPVTFPSATAVGDGCSIECAFALACFAGRCVVGAAPGAPCSASIPCQPALACRAGRCDLGPVVPDCTATPPPPLPHHVGCACTSDDECPADVAGCIASVCTLRPATGDACGRGRLTCLGSSCVDHVCD